MANNGSNYESPRHSQEIKSQFQKCFIPKEEKKFFPSNTGPKGSRPRERSVFVKKLYNEVHLPEKKKRRRDECDDIFSNLNSDSDDDITDLLWKRK